MARPPDSIARNTGFALAVKLTGALFTAVLAIFLVRALGPEEYGVFALALGVGGLIQIPSDLGIGQATARYVAESRGDSSRATAFVADALRLKFIASGLISIALVALAEPIASAYNTPELAWPIRIMAISVFAQSFMLFCDAIFQATGRIAVYLRVVALESFTETGLTIGLVLLGGGAAGAIAGRAAAYGLAAGFGVALLARTLGRRIFHGRGDSPGHMRRIAGYGSALVIIEGAFTLFGRIGVLLIGAIISVTAVGKFEAAMRLVTLLGYGGQAVGAGVAPRMARGDQQPNLEAFERGLRLVIVVQGLALAPLLVWAEPIADLILGSEFQESAEVIRALAPYAFLLGISPLLALSVNYLGEARRRVPIAIGALVINVVINLLLLSKIGIVAAAIASDVAYTFYAVAHLAILKRMVGLPLRPPLIAFARSLVAAAAMAAVLLALGTGDVALGLVAVGAIVGPLVYLAALMGLGEVSVGQLTAARDQARRLLPSRTG